MSAPSSLVANFYAGKSLLVTGSTGFIGKVLIEKLLRSCAQLDKIYILLRPAHVGQSVQQRLITFKTDRVFKFNNLSQDQLDKLVAIEGDITQPELGISDRDQQLLVDNVSVVFHVAASVRFTGPLKEFVDQNVNGTKFILELGEKMKRLEVSRMIVLQYSDCLFVVFCRCVDGIFQL